MTARPGTYGAPRVVHLSPGVADYSVAYLAHEARMAARDHSRASGGGRALGIEWSIKVHPWGASLMVSYHANRPNGHCGVYAIRVAL